MKEFFNKVDAMFESILQPEPVAPERNALEAMLLSKGYENVTPLESGDVRATFKGRTYTFGYLLDEAGDSHNVGTNFDKVMTSETDFFVIHHRHQNELWNIKTELLKTALTELDNSHKAAFVNNRSYLLLEKQLYAPVFKVHRL